MKSKIAATKPVKRAAVPRQASAPKQVARLVVSVVIYQPYLPHLEACLQSLLASPVKGLELHLVDNSLEPLPVAVLASLGERVIYHHGHGNVGFGAAHNFIIKPLIGLADYWLVLNPDTFFAPTLLPALLQRMAADPRIGLCIPKITNPDGTIQLVNKQLPTPAIMFVRPLLAKVPRLHRMLMPWMRHYLLQHLDLKKAVMCPFVSGCFMLFRGTVLHELGGFDERYFMYMEDVDLSRRAAQKGLNVVFSDLICSHYWERAAYKNRKLFMIMVGSAIKYFNKWGWFFDRQRVQLNAQTGYYYALEKGRG